MQRINIIEFNRILKDLESIWPDITNENRAKRYYIAIADMEFDIVQQIANAFKDTSHKMPLPKDFADAAAMWRRDFYAKTGQFYGSDRTTKKEIINEKPKCNYCWDTGTEFIKYKEATLFAYCFCKKGDEALKSRPYLLPRANDLTGVSRLNFPANSFFPPKHQNTSFALSGLTKMYLSELRMSEKTFAAICGGGD